MTKDKAIDLLRNKELWNTNTEVEGVIQYKHQILDFKREAPLEEDKGLDFYIEDCVLDVQNETFKR